MKVKQIEIKKFKRFTDLKVIGLPETAKIIILAGPNGCGKSSLFEALHTWYRNGWKQKSVGWDATYHSKKIPGMVLSWDQSLKVEFFDEATISGEDRKKAIYLRTAYRNDPDFQIGSLDKLETAVQEDRFSSIIQNDAAVNLNYKRLASQGLEDVYEREAEETTIGEFREKSIGDIRASVLRLFPELELNGLGNPLSQGTFRFDKGESSGFFYKNLSGGEKAAFDLVLDFIVKKRDFDNTVFCIDEPEAHISTRLQRQLLEELYNLLPENCQLWLATHSIGMMRKAKELFYSNPGEVVFLDFEGFDFDQPQILEPAQPDRGFWQRVLKVALDDLAGLVAPKQIVLCEGEPDIPGEEGNKTFDAQCYNNIFEKEFPDTQFVSCGNCRAVERDRLALTEALKPIVQDVEFLRVRDRDDLTEEEINEKIANGIRVLSLRNLECYLLDDETLKQLCAYCELPNKFDDLIAKKTEAKERMESEGGDPDNLKKTAGEIFTAAKSLLNLNENANNKNEFLKSWLVPRIQPEMEIYSKLKADIFGT